MERVVWDEERIEQEVERVVLGAEGMVWMEESDTRGIEKKG